MASTASGRLTWTELLDWPEDDVRRELIGGQLFVTPAPGLRHQRVVRELVVRLDRWTRDHGGEALPGPFDVYLSEDTFCEPDVLAVRAGRVGALEERRIRVGPDLVVEVSSPSTRDRDLGPKRDVYERLGATEYWLVDLETDTVVVHRFEGGRYRQAEVLRRGETVVSSGLPGFRVAVDELLGTPHPKKPPPLG